jgi:Uri superfamily endonuclease
MRGVYVLFFHIEREMELQIGRLGSILFSKGLYAYVGSAQNGLDARIRRHFSKTKKLHWHIDRLLAHAQILNAYAIPAGKEMECRIALLLSSSYEGVAGFGCSDCRCDSHLFLLERIK